MKSLCLAAVILLFFAAGVRSEETASTKKSMGSGPEEIVERIIKVEGSLERPRVIFILPRAKLWKEDLSKRSFVGEILESVYPETVIEDILRNRTVRR
ncbi:MAG: hypothetical protein AABY54_09090 [Deltaproteobacteria bacterium]